jgi:hypothetical protein
MSLRDLSVLDSEPRLGAEFCFNLYDGKKAVLLAASNQQEKMQWMEDIAEAAQVTIFLNIFLVCFIWLPFFPLCYNVIAITNYVHPVYGTGV